MISPFGSGAGSRLPTFVLTLAGISTLVAVLVSVMSIHLQLRNYRKPALQRMVVRIMVMVPLYAISSLISLFSLEAAFVIDAIRDIYEAFVIYCFFVLLLSYIGGERSLLILLHGRPPKEPVFPINLFKREIDFSDPYTFLFMKRGILQYVQVKPALAVATLILKACGKFNEGDFRVDSGYLYISIVYNISICLSLYCLAMFWICINDDVKPFRPVPKFLCIKGILFFSFWQSIGISVLVTAGIIRKLGPYTDREHISLGLTDTLICLEMPLFAFAHMFAFSYKDFIDPHCSYVARMPMYYAFRDAFGFLDVVEDSKSTLRGEGMDYREFEPSEGYIHQGVGRERRIRAGLRYSRGGKRKYWLPKPSHETTSQGWIGRGVNRPIPGRDQGVDVHAPLLVDQGEGVGHPDLDLHDPEDSTVWGEPHADDGYGLPFGDLDEGDEELFRHSRKYLFGDYNYPCIDVSSEDARTKMWDEEERVLRDERGAWFSPIRGSKGQVALGQREAPAWEGYGAVGTTLPRNLKGKGHTLYHEDGKTIDFDQDRVPPVAATDVQLRWTKMRQESRSKSHSHSPHLRNRPGLQAEASSSSSSAESNSSLTTKIRSQPSSTSHGYPRVHDSPNLRPDAVDLIVEDINAAEEERTRERRKGEPAVRGSRLRKIYKRGFVTSRGKEELEIKGTDADDDVDELDARDQVLETVGGHARDTDRQEDVNEVASAGEGDGVVRSQGLPLHSRIFAESYIAPTDDNPWA